MFQKAGSQAAARIGAAMLAIGVLAFAFGGVVSPEVVEAAVYAGNNGAPTGELLLTGYSGVLGVLGAATGGTAFVAAGAIAAV